MQKTPGIKTTLALVVKCMAVAAFFLLFTGGCIQGSRIDVRWQNTYKYLPHLYYKPYAEVHALLQSQAGSHNDRVLPAIVAIDGRPITDGDGKPALIGPAISIKVVGGSLSEVRYGHTNAKYKLEGVALPEGPVTVSVRADRFVVNNKQLYFYEGQQHIDIRFTVQRDRFHYLRLITIEVKGNLRSTAVVLQSPDNEVKYSPASYESSWLIVGADERNQPLLGLTYAQALRLLNAIAEGKLTPQELEGMRREFLRINLEAASNKAVSPK